MSVVEQTSAAPNAPRLRGPSVIAGIVGLAGAALAVFGALADPTAFFRAYLTWYVFFIGIAFGSLFIVMIQFVTGGAWGLVLRRISESAMRMIVPMAVLYVPIAFGLGYLYPWASPEEVASNPILQDRQLFYGTGFFLARTAVYFAIWLVLVYFLNRWSNEQDRTGDPDVSRRLRTLGTGGIVLHALVFSLAIIDWVMSLEPEFHSTIYPPMVAMGEIQVSFAIALLVTILLVGRGWLTRITSPLIFNDLGGLLLAFCILWTYMAFAQFLLSWIENLPQEIAWYLPRTTDGWLLLILVGLPLVFVIPLFTLVFRPVKRNPRRLGAIAALIIVGRLVVDFWTVRPAWTGATFAVTWLDLVVPVALGGIWLAIFLWQLGLRPLIAPNDPRLFENAKVRNAASR